MINENKVMQSCKNCKYFVQHYIKFKVYFHAIDCGHCCNLKVSRSKRKSCPFADGCVRWERAEEINAADGIRQIANAVADMQKHLVDITSILYFMKSD